MVDTQKIDDRIFEIGKEKSRLESEEKGLKFKKDWDMAMPEVNFVKMAEIGQKYSVPQEARLLYENYFKSELESFGIKLKTMVDNHVQSKKKGRKLTS